MRENPKENPAVMQMQDDDPIWNDDYIKNDDYNINKVAATP